MTRFFDPRLLIVVVVYLAAGPAAQATDRSFLSRCLDKSVDACAVYDTGRLTNSPKLLPLESDADLSRHLTANGKAEILILGEVHDNVHHHKLRAALLFQRSIVMEQLRADQADGVAAFNQANLRANSRLSVEDFKAKVGWDSGGWAKYPYAPLLEAVVATRAAVYAGDPPRETVRQLAKKGSGELLQTDRSRLALDRLLGEKLDAASAEEIEASHCGMLPKTSIGNMAFAQRYRDAHLADATLKAVADGGQAVLLTGNSHARTDRGVPWYIRARAPEMTAVSVVLAEVEAGKLDPEAYIPRDPDGKPAADYLVFTPAIERDDPCAAFAK